MSSFVVESKVFEVEIEEKRGKPQAIIVESKRGVSSWIRLGPASVGFFLEGLEQCLKVGKEGKWEKGWKEKGRSFSMVRDANSAGCFLRLGVVDIEKRKYSICIPKGKGEKGGWLAMMEAFRKLDVSYDKKEQKQEERGAGKSFVEMVKRPWNRGYKMLRVEVKEDKISRNLSRLEHCLIGTWIPSVAGGEDLERMGWLMASSWGLKGKLGLASLGKGRVLLEFEFVEETRRVLVSGKRSVGGIQLGLERWNPRYGCLEEGELRNEVWVRILGLPISLWVPSVLRKVGDVCGGFLAIDP